MTTETRPSDAVIAPDRLRAALHEHFPYEAARGEVRVVRAPGRVNLIGEHTDYNLGFVLPAAIDLEIRLAVVQTGDRRVELVLAESGERAGFDLDAIPAPSHASIDYVAGTAWSLAEAGLPLRGMRAVLGSTLPVASGLSSSAALELASAWALLDPSATGPDVDRMRLARLAQRAENEFVGVKSGLMDQFASSLGRAGSAMLLDCRSLEYREVPLRLETHALVVCDTGSPRRLEKSEYNTRRSQCEAGVAVIARYEDGVESLRDVDLAMLERHAGRLDEVIRRRCEHIVRENGRVFEAIEAFEAGDLERVGRVFAASHASLRDFYEVSSRELDAMVEIATSVPGTAAARMTGAGFGGCTVNLVARDAIDRFRETVEREYPARTGLTPAVHVVRPTDGAGVMP